MRIVARIGFAALMAMANTGCAQQAQPPVASQPDTNPLWARDNLVAWSVGPYDAAKRGPEARAQMLQELGFRRYAYYWLPADVPTFEAEIQAMKDHGITLQGWWTPFAADDPQLDSLLALFGKMGVHPDLWFFPPIPTYAELSVLTNGQIPANLDELPMEQRVKIYPVLTRTLKEIEARNWPRTPAERRARLEQEAARIKAIADKARPYGITVDLYSHVQWLGVPENQADVVELLRSQGVDNVGVVYNFSHVRGQDRDDTQDFARVWQRILPYVRTVNIAGTHMENGAALLPGEGDSERAMMRVIEQSGYRGPVGVNAETGGDARVTLTRAIDGLSALAREIGGEQP